MQFFVNCTIWHAIAVINFSSVFMLFSTMCNGITYYISLRKTLEHISSVLSSFPDDRKKDQTGFLRQLWKEFSGLQDSFFVINVKINDFIARLSATWFRVMRCCWLYTKSVAMIINEPETFQQVFTCWKSTTEIPESCKDTRTTSKNYQSRM